MENYSILLCIQARYNFDTFVSKVGLEVKLSVARPLLFIRFSPVKYTNRN